MRGIRQNSANRWRLTFRLTPSRIGESRQRQLIAL